MTNKVFIAVVGLCLSSSVAYAGEWSIGLSALYEAKPYKGLKTKDKILPVPMVSYESENFYFQTLAAGYYLWNQPKDKLSVDLFYAPRAFHPKDSTDEQMKKLDRRRDTVMGGFTYKHHEDWGVLRASLAADILGESNGISADFAYLYSFQQSGWLLEPGIGVVWDSKKQNRYSYGIKKSESVRSGLAEYTPGDSWSPYLELSGYYTFDKNWTAFMMGRVEHLPSEVKNSPMTNRSYSGTLWSGITYTF
ncbi:MipA/OmpV family protein [Xenorhabdus bovienii]|uniref:Scaffolding protein for murein-synthesizing holoenzyme, outer membrane protein n=2 Tax=Xenorhabdus bovienii TaxID=40576 RepID=A0A077P4S0_XENBV|nr:MipA/OmpV family protein [Xenorhabdus bovienii]MDE1473588.1 MipA/OmpV family protein [Xenorhabdus bovienii]MDE1478851.1 MipA/OmpV family protein [Xenorhabdus bovienii]MDE1481479.1 MipA/OmpV family protein [Xenorhabdus bovienii]MDE1485314.1 MipA/OmpV family protein [Xenorhabdus bovienii]MDE1489693.1 MipA/OmpV family protein [Xenorhabdus bovienii]